MQPTDAAKGQKCRRVFVADDVDDDGDNTTAVAAAQTGDDLSKDLAAALDPLSLSHILKIPGTKHMFDNVTKTVMDKLSHYPTFVAA